MDTETAVHAGARQADEDAEFRGRPLRVRRVAVTAVVVIVGLLDGEELETTCDDRAGQRSSTPWNKCTLIVLPGMHMLIVPLTSSRGRLPTFSYLSFEIAPVARRWFIYFLYYMLYIEMRRGTVELLL